MARRNHSRRLHAPYGNQGVGYAEGIAGNPGAGDEGEFEGRGEMGRWGGVQDMISERPGTSLMTAFGVGFGLGLLVTVLLSRREEETWFERYAPDAIQELPDRLKRVGQKVSDSMSGSLRQAGESVASYVPSSWRRW